MIESREDEDRDLRSLLAATDTEPTDELFVTTVTRRIARRHHMTRILSVGAAVAIAAAGIAVVPALLPFATAVAEFPVAHAPTVTAFLASPTGAALSIALAGFLLVRAVTLE